MYEERIVHGIRIMENQCSKCLLEVDSPEDLRHGYCSRCVQDIKDSFKSHLWNLQWRYGDDALLCLVDEGILCLPESEDY